MIERLGGFNLARQRGKPMTMVQKLTLYMGHQRRCLHCARAQLERIALDNPTVKPHIWDAIRAISAVEDALSNEYTRDREALRIHLPEKEPA